MLEPQEDEDGNVMAGDRRLSRADSALPDWQMPDGAYRPVPIVWFTGALFLQFIVQAMLALVLALLGLPAVFNLAFAVLATGVIGYHTWGRGMATASLGWRMATAAMLLITLGTMALLIFPFM